MCVGGAKGGIGDVCGCEGGGLERRVISGMGCPSGRPKRLGGARAGVAPLTSTMTRDGICEMPNLKLSSSCKPAPKGSESQGIDSFWAYCCDACSESSQDTSTISNGRPPEARCALSYRSTSSGEKRRHGPHQLAVKYRPTSFPLRASSCATYRERAGRRVQCKCARRDAEYLPECGQSPPWSRHRAQAARARHAAPLTKVLLQHL